MALICFENVGISAMAAAVPANTINNLDYTEHFSLEEAKKVVEKIGVYKRRFAQPGVCSSDLCYSAAEKLLSDNNIDRSEIDLLVFISQTPDYRMPATSVILQDRLKLSHNTITFDLSLGCSGFIFGLSLIYSFMERSTLRKALLLDGETRSRIYSPKDRQAAFLFGDGAAAALIERSDSFGKSWFSLNSDGSKEDLIKIKAGGYRYPSSPDTMKEYIVDANGNIRSDEHGYMRGSDVFTFVAKEVPSDVHKVIEVSGLDMNSIDYYVFHQANMFINTHILKKLRLDPEKVPSTIDKFGNTSSVSIPLTMVSELKEKIDNKLLLLSGFGVGMTWASCILRTRECKISELVEI
ncbi:MAG TPA: ketoacyl-ACP synthase III [Bacteroidales bacterium]|nr:ketoacyl-ACP synthase III [Bacteroidales bacterium]